MSTTTPRLGLTKPATTEAYDIAVANANMDIVDAAPANFTICTNATRPLLPDNGDGIFETDTNNLLVSHSAIWKAGNGRVFLCTSSTRPSSSVSFGGMLIYETDTGNRLIRNSSNSAWLPLSPYSVADSAALAALTGMTEGLMTFRRDIDVFYVWDGSFQIAHRPLNPFCVEIWQSVVQTLSNNVWTAVTLTSETEDFGNIHDTVTNPSRITIPAGYPTAIYAVSGSAYFAGSTAGGRAVALAKNGSRINGSGTRDTPASDGFGNSLTTRTALVRLAAGEYVELHALQSSGGNLNTFSSAELASGLSLSFNRFV
jgi:hypothetical protein